MVVRDSCGVVDSRGSFSADARCDYHDPVDIQMKLVYIAGPFRASSAFIEGHQDMFAVQEHIMAAMKLGLEVARTPGAFPVIPHANTMFFTGSAPDAVWLDGDLELLRRCDAVLMTPNWERSSGATIEHESALKWRMPVFYEIEGMRQWVKK